MNVYDITQNTDVWEKWRDTGLGASDAATILGLNPYQTPFGLWQIMTGKKTAPDLSKNPNVLLGKKLEPLALSVAEKFVKKKLKPLCASEKNNPFILTSYDGISEDHKLVVEVKCPHELTFETVRTEGKNSKFYLVYWIQVQQQLYVSKAEKAYLIFFKQGVNGNKHQIIPFEILPNIEFQEKELIPSLKRFWNYVNSNIEPPRNPKLDPCDVNMDLWDVVSNEYKKINDEKVLLKAQLEELELKIKPVEEQLLSLMGDNYLADSNGLRVKRYFRSGNVNYSNLIDLLISKLGVNNICDKESLLNKFRSNGTEQVKITTHS